MHVIPIPTEYYIPSSAVRQRRRVRYDELHPPLGRSRRRRRAGPSTFPGAAAAVLGHCYFIVPRVVGRDGVYPAAALLVPRTHLLVSQLCRRSQE